MRASIMTRKIMVRNESERKPGRTDRESEKTRAGRKIGNEVCEEQKSAWHYRPVRKSPAVIAREGKERSESERAC